MNEAKLLNQNLIYTNQLNNPGYPPTLNSEGKLNNNILPDNIVYTENGKISQDILPSGTGKNFMDIIISLKSQEEMNIDSLDEFGNGDFLISDQEFNPESYEKLNEIYPTKLYERQIYDPNNVNSSMKYIRKVKYINGYWIILGAPNTTSGDYICYTSNLKNKEWNKILNNYFDNGYIYDIAYWNNKWYVAIVTGNSNSRSSLKLFYFSDLENINNNNIQSITINIPDTVNTFRLITSMISFKNTYILSAIKFNSTDGSNKLLIYYSSDLIKWNSYEISNNIDLGPVYGYNPIVGHMEASEDQLAIVSSQKSVKYTDGNFESWIQCFFSEDFSPRVIKFIENKWLICGETLSGHKPTFYYLNENVKLGNSNNFNKKIISDSNNSYNRFLIDLGKIGNKYFAISSYDDMNYSDINSTTYGCEFFNANSLTGDYISFRKISNRCVKTAGDNNNLLLFKESGTVFPEFYNYSNYTPKFGTTTGDAKMYIKAR